MAGEPRPLTSEQAIRLGGEVAGVDFGSAPDPLIGAARDIYNRGEAEKTLEVLAGKAVPHAREDVERGILARSSTARDADGKRIAPTDARERQRFNESKKSVDQARKYLEQGDVDPSLKVEVRTFLLNNSPAFKSMTEGMSITDINAVIDGFVFNNPHTAGFRDNLLKLYSERGDPNRKLQSEDTVRSLQKELTGLEAQLIGQATAVDVTNAENALHAAELTLASGTSPVNLTEYNTNKNDFETLSAQVSEAKSAEKLTKAAYDSIDTQIKDLESQLSAGSLDVTNQGRARDQIAKLKANEAYATHLNAKDVINRYDAAKDYMDKLTAGQKNTLRDYDKAKKHLEETKEKFANAKSPEERAKIEAEIKAKKEELADAQDDLDREMREEYRDMKHMAGDAAQAFLNEEFSKLPDMYREAATKSQERDEILLQGAQEKFTNLWKTRHIGRHGLTTWRTNRQTAGQWVGEYFRSGPEGFARTLQALPDTRLLAAGMTPEEISAFRNTMNNADSVRAFANEQGKTLGVQALGDYFGAGGKMSKAERNAILSSPAGREFMQKANEELQAFKQAQAETDPSTLRFIDRSNVRKGALAALLILLGLTGAGIAGVALT